MRGLITRPADKRADQSGDPDLAKIRIDLDLGEHGAMGMHGVGGLRRGISCPLAAGFDRAEAGPAQDVGVTFAATFVVAPKQPAVARHHAGIA